MLLYMNMNVRSHFIETTDQKKKKQIIEGTAKSIRGIRVEESRKTHSIEITSIDDQIPLLLQIEKDEVIFFINPLLLGAI